MIFKAKRSWAEKRVVRVKIDAGSRKQRNEGPPSDSWSWRKYGQKPIKGSPYPRGYYRCSTFKDCSAKKQVERCRTDGSMLIITYTSTHNHPARLISPHPEHPSMAPTPEQAQQSPEGEEGCMDHDDHPLTSSDSHLGLDLSARNIDDTTDNPFTERVVSEAHGSVSLLSDEEQGPASCPPTSGENEFFDDLGELPASTSFITSFTRNNIFDEWVLVFPS